MSIAETIKLECKKQKIAVSKMEKDLGFCNGYVRGLKDKIPLDRAKRISAYLGITLSCLTEDCTENTADDLGYFLDPETLSYAEELRHNPELKAVFDVARDMPKEKLEAIYNVLKQME